MLDFLGSALHTFAQKGGTGSGAGGDSGSVFFLVIAAVAVVVVVAGLVILRSRSADQSRSPREDANRPTEIGGTGASGRPLHKDPDPQNLAGGRARFTPPPGD